MMFRDLIPWGRTRSSVPTMPQRDEANPFLTLHREMNRLFDEAFRGFEGGLPAAFGMPTWPSLEVNATDRELRVAAELPGLDEKDVEILVDKDTLTIRGEKRAETKDTERHFSERYYGRFERVIPLPFAVEDGKAEASFKNGVLTVKLPRSETAEEPRKRIAINANGDTKH